MSMMEPDSLYEEQTHYCDFGEEKPSVNFLAAYGLHFNEEGRLVDIKNGSFVFNVNVDSRVNQERYENICVGVELYVNDLLEQRLLRVPLHPDGKGTFIFTSRDYQDKEHLLVLIHGSGAVRAGQWSRRLIINDTIDSGTQLPYIDRALQLGWGVLVTNTNDNHPHEGSRSPTEHGRFVWENFVKFTNNKKIAIVAHSAGGGVTTDILNNYSEDFERRVFAIAFTDAFGQPQYHMRNYFKSVTTNWVTSREPLGTPIHSRHGDATCISAGTPTHEETSHMAIDRVFEYIEDSFDETTPGRAVELAEMRRRGQITKEQEERNLKNSKEIIDLEPSSLEKAEKKTSLHAEESDGGFTPYSSREDLIRAEEGLPRESASEDAKAVASINRSCLLTILCSCCDLCDWMARMMLNSPEPWTYL